MENEPIHKVTADQMSDFERLKNELKSQSKFTIYNKIGSGTSSNGNIPEIEC